ncbi:hypothetical protein AA313_de0208273 [Arthrobotrys entomopaga]|nr:hypothetical protein AA313_de0208273 [Arthrobotrys entomopaga]
MDTPDQFHFSLLRIATAQVLRHAGLTGSRPSVLDSFTDITGRYLTLLGNTARTISESSNRTTSELSDVLSAMEHLGLLKPLTIYTPDPDDTRAIDNFIEWAKSPEIEELRKLAGVITVEVDEQLETVDEGGETLLVAERSFLDTTTTTLPLTNGTKEASKQPSQQQQQQQSVLDKETDIPIKREILDDQPTPMMLMDIDGVPLLEDMDNPMGAISTPGINRDTEPPGDAEETAKAKVKLKQVDWFTALKMKEDAARFNGTVLGKHDSGKKVVVEGGDSVPVDLPGLSS